MAKAKLYIEGYIGENDGFMEAMGVESNIFSAKDLSTFLKNNQDAEEIEVEIRSGGGSVEQGIDIYDQLINCGKQVTTIAYECASIATIIFLAGSKRLVSKNAMPLIHNPYIDGYAVSGLDADALAELSDAVRAQENRILDIYVERTGADRTELSDIMSMDKQITSDKFMELGFATEMINGNPIEARKVFAYIKAHSNLNNQYMKTKEVKSLFSKMMNMLNEALKGSIVNLELTLQDGNSVWVKTEATEAKVGDEVYTDAEFTMPVEDGTHTLEDGVVVVTEKNADGIALITEILATGVDSKKDEEITDLKAKIETLETTNATLETEKSGLQAKLDSMVQAKAAHDNSLKAIKAEFDDFKALVLDNTEDEGYKPVDKSTAQKALELRKHQRNLLKK
jgi:ATP-dependent Clp protease protease subunit